jgi:hypothetical protein
MRSQKRTLELALYVADYEFHRLRYLIDDPQLFCIAVMFFVLKFEGDVNTGVADFFRFVVCDLGVSISQITRIEAEILVTLPTEFGRLSPLCEIFNLADSSEGSELENDRFSLSEQSYQEYLDHLIILGFSHYQFRCTISQRIPFARQLKSTFHDNDIKLGFVTTLDSKQLLARSSSPQRLTPSPAPTPVSARQTKRVKLG